MTSMPRRGRILLWFAAIYLLLTGTVLVWQGSVWWGQSSLIGTGAILQEQLEEQGRIVHVQDGDTIEVRLQGTDVPIRLIGVDTPESVHPTKGVECFGKEASAFTKQFLGNMATLREDPTQDAYDVYGRKLAYVFLEDGRNLNQLLVEEGIGREYTYQKPYQYQSAFRAAQQEARQNRRGLWGVCS